jgi:hypothetical protein
MKSIIIILLPFLSASVMASSTLETLKVLKSCSNDYVATSELMTKELLLTTIWNYDNDYDKTQVAISEEYDFSKSSFKVNVYIDVEGLRDFGYVYEIFPKFYKDGTCNIIDTRYEEM